MPDSGLHKNSIEMETTMFVLDRYMILEKIGEGGNSIVYKGMDTILKRQVAIKFARKQNEQAMLALRREGEYLKCLKHPMIPILYDRSDTAEATECRMGYKTDNVSACLVMEYVEGKNLYTSVLQNGVMQEKQVVKCAYALLDFLEYLHTNASPLIYCDLKPENIILCKDGSIKLVDFGSIVESQHRGENPRWIAGTRGYASPEQMSTGSGETALVDERSDIYGFGKTLYFLLTGLSVTDLPKGLLPVRCANPLLKKRYDGIIRKCVKEDKEQRFQNVSEVRKALQKGRQRMDFEQLRQALKYRCIRKIEKQIWLCEKKEEYTFYKDSYIL